MAKIKEKLKQAKYFYRLAQWILLNEIFSLNAKKNINLSKSHSVLNTRILSLKESFAKTGRLDAEYYELKFDKNEEVIKNYKNGFTKLRNLVKEHSSGFAFSSEDYLQNGELALIRINNIKNNDLDLSNVVYLDKGLENLSIKDKVKKDDILISMSGSIGLSCVVRKEIKAMVNQRILRISISNFSPNVLALFLNSNFAKLQFERIGTGGVQTNLSSNDMLNLFVPLLPLQIQENIEAKITQSFTLKEKSKSLLEAAKIKVEKMINNKI